MDVPTLKVLLIGDSSVGKSAILQRYCSDLFNSDEAVATIGVDHKVQQLEIGGTVVRLIIWDTAGQERFRTMTSSYYRGAHAIMLVFDVTNRETFEHLPKWLEECNTFIDFSSRPVKKMIVGNKIDRASAIVVSNGEAKQLAQSCGAKYVETSAKTRAGVAEAFESLVGEALADKRLLQDADNEMSEPRVRLTSQVDEASRCAC